MSNNGPINMEDEISEVPSVAGREVNPDVDEKVDKRSEAKPMDQHMARILEHVPDNLKERVSKLQREELSMPGAPRDRDAYEAYLGAEKMIRDIRRREEKAKINFNNLPRQNG